MATISVPAKWEYPGTGAVRFPVVTARRGAEVVGRHKNGAVWIREACGQLFALYDPVCDDYQSRNDPVMFGLVDSEGTSP